uniref:Arginine/serine-rich splicing factor n=1 Tax=Solanum tuberosum TaxID=4113 RepID=M0ZH54_SOLTU
MYVHTGPGKTWWGAKCEIHSEDLHILSVSFDAGTSPKEKELVSWLNTCKNFYCKATYLSSCTPQ